MTRRITPQTTLDNLKKEAKRWLKALRSFDTDARARFEAAHLKPPTEPTLRDVQHALAREYGLDGWAALRNAIGSKPPADSDREKLIHHFLEYACPDHHVRGRPAHTIAQGAAMRLLERHPDIARANLSTAVVCGEIDEVRRILTQSPQLARVKSAPAAEDRTGPGESEDIDKDISPKGWEPLLFLCFARLPLAKANDNALEIAKLLLDHGADPNVYFMAGSSQYTPLVGAIGEGEENRPPHPRRDELSRLLLERGADPYDMQVVYNIHFHGKILWFMKLMYEFSVKAGRKADWDDPDWHMRDMDGYGSGARWHLWVAVQKNDLELAEWCLAHGANPNAGPANAKRLPQCSLYESALRLGQTEMAELLARYGAVRTTLLDDDEDVFVAAALRLDRNVAERMASRHPELLRSTRAIFAAAKQDRADAVAMLLDLGVPINIEDESKQRPLHVAAWGNALNVAKLLIDRGAEIDPYEKNWGNAPINFAIWEDLPEMIELLAPHSRELWGLSFTGHVARIREIVTERPELAKATWDTTPLFSLPDDEEKAAEIVDLFVSLGADASFRRKDGLTAADVARRRGLDAAADKLEAAAKTPVASEAGVIDLAKTAPYEALANDLVLAFDTGDAEALARFNRRFKQSLTADDLRAQIWKRVYSVRQAGGGPGSLQLGEARLLIARNAGFANWDRYMEAMSTGAPLSAPYAIGKKENRIGPRRMLSAAEWDTLIGVMKERKISQFHANGFVTDDVLARIAELDHVTHLDLGGAREVSDHGLLQLAKMPQLQYLDLSEYPGGKLTDRGLTVLRHLPELRSFAMTWQKGISDEGAANLKYCNNIESVKLMGSPTGDGTIAALRGKAKLNRFESGRLVTDAGLAMLHDFPLLKSWHGPAANDDDDPTRLLVDGPFTNQGLAGLAALDGVYALDLFWHCSGITSAGLEVLTRMANLGSLGCDGNLSDDHAMQYYATIPKLRKLRAQGSAATDEGFIALSRSQTLETFWGREAPGLTGRGFAAFSKMPRLRVMGVSLKNVDDESLARLSQFPALRELTPIDVQDPGFRHVGKCEQLERLVCMYCRDTTDQATEFIRGLRLKSYYAGKTKITDRTLEILSAMPTLERIEFWECAGITDAGLKFLAALPNLREVEFGNVPGVTLEGTAVFPDRVNVDYST
jgi:ankyrin repeat protein